MKYLLTLITLGLLSSIKLLSQNPNIDSLSIKYVDFSTETDAKVECKNFEDAFPSYGIIKISDLSTTLKIQNFIKTFNKDTIDHYYPDTRGKIIIYYKKGKKDTICISNFGIQINDQPMITNDKFIGYIKNIIKQRDHGFK